MDTCDFTLWSRCDVRLYPKALQRVLKRMKPRRLGEMGTMVGVSEKAKLEGKGCIFDPVEHEPTPSVSVLVEGSGCPHLL